MSQPDHPETVYCPEGHAYRLDELSKEQRRQYEMCPYCNPADDTGVDPRNYFGRFVGWEWIPFIGKHETS